MDYVAAIKRPFENLEMYLTLSLLSFIPVANIYVLGYLLDHCSGEKLEGRKMVKRFVRGSEFFALIVIYAFLPALTFYLFGLKASTAVFIFLFPAFSMSTCKLAKGSLEEALEINVIKEAYNPRFVAELSKIVVATLFSFFVHALFPVIGWIGIIYGPASSFMYMLGKIQK